MGSTDSSQRSESKPHGERGEDAERETEQPEHKRPGRRAVSTLDRLRYQNLPRPRRMYRIGPIPQKKVMMIHSTFHAPLRSVRLTMSMMQRTKAIGCRKIAKSTSTTNLII